MLLSDIIEKLGLNIINADNFELDIKKGHVGDLLSEVMRTCEENSIWITHQTHQNIIAVAEVVGAKAIILPEELEYGEDAVEKARDHHVALLTSDISAFKLCGEITKLLEA